MRTIGDVDLRAESCALVECGAVEVEVEGCHRIRRTTFDKHPYLARGLSVFSRQVHLGIPKGG